MVRRIGSFVAVAMLAAGPASAQDPMAALQAAMDGFEVNTLENLVANADIFITATGNRDVITLEHLSKMKNKAIVGNIGHFDNEIDMAGLNSAEGVERRTIKPQYDEYVFPDGHGVLILAEEGCSTWVAPPGTPASSCQPLLPTRCWPSLTCMRTPTNTKPRCSFCPGIWTRRWPDFTWNI